MDCDFKCVLRVVALCFAALLLPACHLPPIDVPVSEGGTGAVAPVPAPGHVPADAPTSVSAPSSAGHALSYRAPAQAQPPRQLADGAQLPAVQGFLEAAERAVRSNNLDVAAASLERAQRLAPQSAIIYQRLADIRLRQKRPAEAEQLLRKALGLAAIPTQQAQLWRQLAVVRQQLGQMQAAMEALQRAAALESPKGQP